MKLSAYNLSMADGGDLIVYNTLTGALVVINQDADAVREAIEHRDISRLPSTFWPGFHDLGVIVDADYDEQAVIRVRNLTGRTQNELILSVMTTLRCNFRCSYCFQKRCQKRLTKTVESSIMSMLLEKIPKLDRLSIDWYGGEPLLERATLFRLNSWIAELCKRHDTEYIVTVTTNGYLLDKEMIDYLSKFKVGHLQITLDGPPETHNLSRKLTSGGKTFATILANICRARGAGLPVSIRVNVWRPNASKVADLYGILEANGLKNQVAVLAKPVLSSDANPCALLCLEPAEASSVIMQTYMDAANDGWIVLPYADALQGHEFCIVDSVGQFIIDPSGSLYKCGENFDASEKVGALTKSGNLLLDEPKWRSWISKDPFANDECVRCQFLPICMGGCSMKRKWKPTESPCVELKHVKDDFLRVLRRSEENREGG
ncbi:MAG: radical SAM protein [Candidatus Berkelbacteria bacterium]|nr:radical SAM protein [Candidatus Berkelbacteria bacterium]